MTFAATRLLSQACEQETKCEPTLISHNLLFFVSPTYRPTILHPALMTSQLFFPLCTMTKSEWCKDLKATLAGSAEVSLSLVGFSLGQSNILSC